MIPEVDQIALQAIERRIFPGAVILVARDGRLHHSAAYGTTMYADAGSQPVTLDTRYDIASLTKVFTATAALRLLDMGRLGLDTPAACYLPGLRARGVTLRHLLTHTSGLDLQLSKLRQLDPLAMRAQIYATEPVCAPGTCVAYTNINSLLLGDVVARVYGAPLNIVLAALLLEPLGLRDTCFCPPTAEQTRIAPTEWDHTWRGRLVQGSVHDESAHALGGVAGHAGLFSTARDILRFARMWLDSGVWEGQRLLHAETVALATRNLTRSVAHVRAWNGEKLLGCGLGWMVDRPIFMGNAPAGTYGHTGFTGPVVALVPHQRLAVVLLSNRTYPRRTPPAHHAVTAAILEVVLNHFQDPDAPHA